MNRHYSRINSFAALVILAVLALSCHGPAWAGEHGGGEAKKDGEAPPEKNGEAKTHDDDANYVRLRGIAATVFSDGQPAGAISIDVYLELKNPGDKENVQAMEPRLRDRYLQKLGLLGHTRISMYRPLDLDLIGNALQAATDDVLGAAAAHVLISAAGVRRF